MTQYEIKAGELSLVHLKHHIVLIIVTRYEPIYFDDYSPCLLIDAN